MFSRLVLQLLCVLGLAWLGSGSASTIGRGLLTDLRAGTENSNFPSAVFANQGDKFPNKDAFRRLGTMRFRTGDGILSLVYSPDGKVLVSGGRNDVVRMWDAQSGQLIREFNEPWVWAVAFTPDGKYLATGGANKVIRLWNVDTGKEVRQMVGHKATVKALAFSSDGSALVSGGDDNTVRLWKVTDGSEISSYTKHTFGVNAVAMSPDMKHFASASTDRTIRVWEYGDKPVVMRAPAAVTAIAYLPDCKTLISACDDGFVRVWDIAAGKQTREWKGHNESITHIALSQDGTILATAGLDKKLRIWDVAKGTQRRDIERKSGDCDALAMTRDGKWIAAGGTNNVIQSWDAATGQQLPAGAHSEGAVTALVMSGNGRLAAVGYSTGQGQMFDPAIGAAQGKKFWEGNDNEVLLALSRDGRTLAIANPPDKVFCSKNDEGRKLLPLPEGDEIRCLSLSPDGLKLAIGYASTGVRVWDIAAGKIHQHLPMHHGARAVAYSVDGKLLAIGSEDAIVIHDAASYRIVRQFPKLNDTVACLGFSPDGRTLAAGMFAGNILLFDMAIPKDKTDTEPRHLEGHRGVVNALSWSVNGRCLVSGGFDKTVRIWEFVNGQPITNWPGHLGEVTAVAFHPSGRTVLSGSRDTTVLWWDATGLGLNGKLPEPKQIDPVAFEALWKDLASDNNVKGNSALWAMCTAKGSAEYLSKKVFLTDPKKIKQYLNDLDSNIFKVREKAYSALAGYERWIEGVLTDTLRSPPSEEVRQRVDLLLKRLRGQDAITLDQERLRARRVIEILEQTKTPAARELLRGLAAGAAEENLRDMAQAAVARLARD